MVKPALSRAALNVSTAWENVDQSSLAPLGASAARVCRAALSWSNVSWVIWLSIRPMNESFADCRSSQ